MADLDYNIRPAKHVERGMLVHALRRLATFGSVESYRYIGFGAYYFRDFTLFHRDLGIQHMISVEREQANKDRYEFNKPFTCVEVEFDSASVVLPTLAWDVRTILWLDYTGSLDREALADVEFFCSNAPSGSVLIVTVNAHPGSAQDRVDALRQRVGEVNVPPDVDAKSLAGWGTARVSRRILGEQILATLNARNGGRSPGNAFAYQQLFNFEYADGAKMVTVGGILYEVGQKSLVDAAAFADLPFVRSGADAFRIEVPKLTYKEIHHLQAHVPGKAKATKDDQGIPADEIARYQDLYRYFPVFASTDI